MSKKKYHVVSFSGGKDSTALLVRMLEIGMQVDEILFCDTTVEFPAMYEHIEKVERLIGRKITRLKADKSFEYLLLHHAVKTIGKNNKGYSFADAKNRWCTAYFKRDLVNKHLRSVQGDVVQYIGIAADEAHRARDKRYPLIDWGWTEADCLRYCYEKGFNWGGLYNLFHRVSCWCCPLQSLDELRKLRKHYPDLWAKLLGWQLQTWRKFRTDFSVQELESRFALEEERQAAGLPISMHNADFRRTLAFRLGRGEWEQMRMF